jgi:hypothetical protein
MENKIGMAKQNGSSVEVYDVEGHYLFSRTGELAGFTSQTVAVKEGNSICVYDSTGSYKFSR